MDAEHEVLPYGSASPCALPLYPAVQLGERENLTGLHHFPNGLRTALAAVPLHRLYLMVRDPTTVLSSEHLKRGALKVRLHVQRATDE